MKTRFSYRSQQRFQGWFILPLLLLCLLFCKTASASSNPCLYGQTNANGDWAVTCTWYAWQQVHDNLGEEYELPQALNCNAGDWLERAQSLGMSTGTIPVAGSVAVWQGGDEGWGHVAYVTEVNGATMTFNEGGVYTSPYGFNGDTASTSIGSAFAGSTLIGFIYPTKLLHPCVFNDAFYAFFYGSELGNMTQHQRTLHWLKYGVFEGRYGSPAFSAAYYYNKYDDLRTTYGNNMVSLASHFVDHGLKEGRQASFYFDPAYYRSTYPDLQQTFGSNYVGITLHFFDHGIPEFRNSSEEFGLGIYRDNYMDLQNTFGSSAREYIRHYDKYGKKEGRITDHRLLLIFNPNGGSVDIKSKEVTKNVAYGKLPDPQMDGYTFQGWYTEQSGGEKITSESLHDVIGDRTVYAHWENVLLDEYTITYDANGGIGEPKPQRSGDEIIILSSSIPSRTHYHFLGWSESRTASIPEYSPGDTYTKRISITLYAVWEKNNEQILKLPTSLTTLEDEALMNINADIIIIPATVSTIGNSVFDDVIIYGYEGSAADIYSDSNGFAFVPITDGWVPEDAVPAGAHVTDEKWTYTLTTTETITSTATSMEGWIQNGYTWEQTGTHTWIYANYPSGFDTTHSLYSKYNNAALNDTLTETSRREVSSPSHYRYIYWHWTMSNEYGNWEIHDVEGSDGRYEYHLFHAFEGPDLKNRNGMTTSGTEKSFDNIWSTYHYPEYSNYGPWWWWRLEVYQQTYTDYQKLFIYVKDNSEVLESFTEVIPGNGITNVQHWVKYSF